MPTQPNFTPRSGARPVGLVAACLGHQRGGGGKEPRSCSGREKSSPSCRAGLPGPSHPPSAGLGLPTPEMGQRARPMDGVKCTYHLPDEREALPHLLLSLAYNNSETQVELPLCYTREQSSGRGSHSLQGADQTGTWAPAANSRSFPKSGNRQRGSCQSPIACPRQTSLIDHSLFWGIQTWPGNPSQCTAPGRRS